MAENRTKRNYFTRSLGENSKIDERFRDIMYDTFDGLYNAMGKKNFLRWINTRKMSERIKTLIVEEFTEEDLKRYPNYAGYYTTGTNRERLRAGHINTSVASHETLHFLTDGVFVGKNFPAFINEGLTEYLNREFAKTNTNNPNIRYTYSQNVDFVEFLHDIIGDSLIKAYLTGISKAFSTEFSTYITADGRQDTMALDRFYESLNKVHYVLHPNKNPQTAEEREESEKNKRDVIENCYPKIRESVVHIASNAIRKKAHDLGYYEDGKFNVAEVVEDINLLIRKTDELLKKNAILGLSHSSKESLELYEGIFKNSLVAVLQESHIPNDRIEDIVSKSIRNGSITVQGNVNSMQYPIIKRDALYKEIHAFDVENPVKGLINKRLGNKENYMDGRRFNITSFLMDASLVLDKMNLQPDLRQAFLDSAILRCLPQEVNHELVKTMIDKYGKLYVALYQKQQDNKRDVVDSKFVKISDTKFIEKRDSKIFFLDYDEKTGTFSEREVFGEYYDQIMRFSDKTVDKFGGTVKRKTYIDRNTQGASKVYSVMFNEDFSTVTVGGKLCEVMSSPEKLGDSFLIDEAMRPIRDGISKNRYVSILKDGEEPVEDLMYTLVTPDTRSRVINYGLFLKELRGCVDSVPKELRRNLERREIGSLIFSTYLIKPENIEEIQDYICGLSSNTITADKVLNQLYDFTESLNQARRSYVEQESKYTMVCFKNEDAKKRWVESLKSKEERRERTEFFQNIDAFVITDSMECIVESLEVRTDKEHYSTIDGIKYPQDKRVEYRTAIASKVDYDSFCDKLKATASSIDEEKRDRFIKKVIEESVAVWYGSGGGYTNEDKITDERIDLSDEVVEILSSRIIGNSDVDMTRVSEIEKRLLELSKEEETICLGILEERKPEGFENETLERDYQTIKSINEMETIPEETKTQIIQDLKSRSKMDLDKKRRMDSFAKLALSGEHTPNSEDVKRASRFINFYKDFDRE